MILRSVVKYTNEEAHRGENDFDLSMCELESFIAIQYDRGLFTLFRYSSSSSKFIGDKEDIAFS